MNSIKNKKHILSVDFESWIFSKKINSQNLSISDLKKLDAGYSPKALKTMLKALKKNNQKITFFVVSKLEQIYPGIIETILEDGHEVGWHSHTHVVMHELDTLKKELDMGSEIITKYKMKGFQAPNIVFMKKGYKYLKDYGFTYSSSIYGNSNKIYKFNDVFEIPVTSHKKDQSHAEIEFPTTLLRSLLKREVPLGSSFFWGLLGGKFYHKKLSSLRNKGEIINMFIHDWQILTPKSEIYKKDVGFFWNPLFLPYKINVRKMFEELVSKHEFTRFDKFIKDFNK